MSASVIKHIVLFSGGIGSWMAAMRVKEEHGVNNMILLFTDTLIEDSDLYRFLMEAALDIGAPLVWIKEGRTPWQVFEEEKFIGNTKVDPCSRILKREFADKWIEGRFAPEDCVVYVGIDWSEINRFTIVEARKRPYTYEAPMIRPPYLTKNMMLDELKKTGIRPPRLYELGFPHNNCGGFCVKAGQGQFKLLYKTFPKRYESHMRREAEIGQFLAENTKQKKVGDKKYSILRDRRGGKMKPMPLSEFKARIDASEPIDELDFGGCGCFIDY